ncbi:MAG: hypothetical protein JWQ09_2995 [Segetibacter sp.]|nr:hypothetical protein [Segetibacter sp.]
MEALTLAGEILPVLGTISLLGLWLFQQNQIEKNSNELQKLNSAYNAFQTYQSNNAIFNAINLNLKSATEQNELRRFQLYNYELGLYQLKNTLYNDADTPTYSFTGQVSKRMEEVQLELTKLQLECFEKQKLLRETVKANRAKYFWIFIIISIVSLTGSVCKAVDKIIPQNVSATQKP